VERARELRRERERAGVGLALRDLDVLQVPASLRRRQALDLPAELAPDVDDRLVPKVEPIARRGALVSLDAKQRGEEVA
jgi:hypothetical protein